MDSQIIAVTLNAHVKKRKNLHTPSLSPLMKNKRLLPCLAKSDHKHTHESTTILYFFIHEQARTHVRAATITNNILVELEKKKDVDCFDFSCVLI